MRIHDIATIPAVSCAPDAPVEQVARLMLEHNVGSVIVVDSDGHPVGIVTDRDLVLRVLAPGLPVKTPTQDMMSHDLIHVHEDAEAVAIMNQMAARAIRRLPVVDADERLVGVITFEDVAQLMAAQIDKVVRALHTGHAPPTI